MSENIEKKPMPGPPECLPTGFPHEGAAINAQGCLLHARSYRANSKRLTDAECAAEFWRALCDTEEAMTRQGVMDFIAKRHPERKDTGAISAQIRGNARDARTWHRFATHPHALEVHE